MRWRKPKPKKEFTLTQPQHGDNVLTCGHEEGLAKNAHFWQCPPDTFAFRHDGASEGRFEVKWLVACDACFYGTKNNPDLIGWNKFEIWTGNDPIVTTNPNVVWEGEEQVIKKNPTEG